MANLFLCHDDEGNNIFLSEEDYLEHSRGPWKEHKYLYIDGDGNYIYEGDTSAMSIRKNKGVEKDGSDTSYTVATAVDRKNNRTLARSYKNAGKNYAYAISKNAPDSRGVIDNMKDDDQVTVGEQVYYDENGNRISATQVNISAIKNISKDIMQSTVSAIRSSSAYQNGKKYLKSAVFLTKAVKANVKNLKSLQIGQYTNTKTYDTTASQKRETLRNKIQEQNQRESAPITTEEFMTPSALPGVLKKIRR